MHDMNILNGGGTALFNVTKLQYITPCLLFLFCHPVAPHNYTVLGPSRLSPVPGLWPSSLRGASGAPCCKLAAPLSAGHRHSSEGREGHCQAHHAFPPLFLRHYCFHPHHQGNTEQEGVDQ